MVYVRQWHDFATGVRCMQDMGVGELRFCSKWRHSRGLLTLKVTNSKQCLQFRTRSALFLNRFQHLTQTTLRSMQAKSTVQDTDAVSGRTLATDGANALAPVQVSNEDSLNADAPNTKAGVAKKKKNKKRKQ